MVQTYLTAIYLVVFQRQKDISADDLNMNERGNITDNKQVYNNCWCLKACFNCGNSCTMCDEIFCKLHEVYVIPIEKCPWWVKNNDLSYHEKHKKVGN